MAEIDAIKLDGRDNYGRPRQEFADLIAAMDEDTFKVICNLYIWLSAYAGNNPSADWHWKADACHDEAKRRGRPDIYQGQWRALYAEASR